LSKKKKQAEVRSFLNRYLSAKSFLQLALFQIHEQNHMSCAVGMAVMVPVRAVPVLRAVPVRAFAQAAIAVFVMIARLQTILAQTTASAANSSRMASACPPTPA
jgi:hypothetical protein